MVHTATVVVFVDAGLRVSDGELCVYVPRSRVLFAGDAVYEGMVPNTRFAGSAERAEWVRHLRRLRFLEIDVLVPGHGALCGKQEIDRNIAVLEGLAC